MIKQYCIQNLDHGSSLWTRIGWVTDDLTFARSEFKKALSDYKYPKDKSFRLISFVVTDKESSVFERPAKGCVLIDVLEFYAGG